jgi:hypothetical protein
MVPRIVVLSLVLSLAGLSATLHAEERVLEFVAGLRERQYFDYAIVYLDGLAADNDLNDELRQLIPYEKALTLIENSRILRNPQQQLDLLTQAEAFLAEFVKNSPNHPRAGDANYERATIILNKARVEIMQSRSPTNQGAKGEYQQRARDLIAQARAIFQKARDQYEAHWKTFPTFIDAAKEPGRKEQREAAEIQLIKASLDLSLCTYEEAQTYNNDDPNFRRLLGEAAVQFEALHQQYRSQVGGLYARLWQGKCFEEQGDLQKAMGVYNELLSHPGDSPALRRLKDQTLQFKLIVLNKDERKDHQLVVNMAEEWLKANTVAARTRVGLGIRWEMARAYEALGDDRTAEKGNAERNLRSARTEALNLLRFPSEFRDVAQAMVQRADGKLGGRDRRPETFDQAYGLARQMVNEIKPLRDAVNAAKTAKKPAAEIAAAEKDVTNKLAETAAMFETALELVSPKDDRKSLSNARYLYAYVLYLQRKNYEAAILGDYVARTADREDGTLGLDAAYLAMGAYVQAFNDMQQRNQGDDADLSFIVAACNEITSRWPESDRANDARMQLGRIFTTRKEPVEAAKWFSQIPDTDARYAEAQMSAGQAFWTAYLTEAVRPADERAPTDQLAAWRTSAKQHLQAGMDKLIATMPKEGAAPDELIAGKVSMAQILVSNGQEAEAIKLLTVDPHAVVKAVAVADETKRPEKGVQSRIFATEAYKLLLRSYVGAGKLDEARATMKTLESIAGGDGGGDVTQLYVELGRLLKSELDRYRESGETDQFNRLMSSFETFLGDLAGRTEGQTFGSLSWIGETYFALGEASSADPSKADAYFDKAGTAFSDILKNAPNQLNYAPPGQLLVVKLRLVSCLRTRKDFEDAQKLVSEVLTETKDDLKVQSEAARVYQDWGSSGDSGTEQYLLTAINGNPEIGAWGWGNLANRLQNTLSRGLRPELQTNFLEAHYNSALCRKRYAETLTTPDARVLDLERAEMELVATAAITKNMPEEWRDQYNKLYREVLLAAGKPQEDLPEGQEFAAAEQAPRVRDEETAAAVPETVTPIAAQSSGKSSSTFIVFLVFLVLGIGAAGYLVLKSGTRPKGGKAFAGGVGADASPFVMGETSAAAVPAKVRSKPAAARPSPTAAEKPAVASEKPAARVTDPAAKPAVRRKPEEPGSQAAKPSRPRPPKSES